jgi:plasmid stabilization system protein ParE
MTSGQVSAEHLDHDRGSFAVGEYVIIYRIEHEDVLILHVMRGKPRHPGASGLAAGR